MSKHKKPKSRGVIKGTNRPATKAEAGALNRQALEVYPEAEKRLRAEIEAAKQSAADRALKEHDEKDD